MTERLRQMLALNPEFQEAVNRGEKWALQQQDEILGLDGKASRRHPERNREQDGKPRDWCGSCPHSEGCIICDLDEDPTFLKEYNRECSRAKRRITL